MKDLKKLLSEISKLDRFQLMTQLGRFFIQDVQDDVINLMKLKLRKVVLEEIVKLEEGEHSVYSEQLKQTIKIIQDKSKGFSCCYSGCRYEAKRHRSYIKHIKSVHPRASNITCKFENKCIRNFLSIDSLISHIRDDHTAFENKETSRLPAVVSTPCKCSLSVCGGIQFSSVKELLTHYNTVHLKDARSCVFLECNKHFPAFATSWKHFRTKHGEETSWQLKQVHRVENQNLGTASGSGENADLVMTTEVSDLEEIEVYDAFDMNDLENGEPDEDDNEDYFMKYYADFLRQDICVF